MRGLIYLLLFILVAKPVFTQAPDKQEMQNQMGKAVKVLDQKIAELEKQIDEAIKNKERATDIELMKNSLKTMKETRNSLSGSTKQFVNSPVNQSPVPQFENQETSSIPKMDATRISSLPKKTLTEAELIPFIKNVNAGVERLIPAAEKTEALNIYNETKAKYKTTPIVANAATGCWMLGHWEKALFIMGKACADDMTDADNLNNYAAFLIMTGGEQAAIPILEYLNSKYPNNSTILNNLGQAWFGLGEMNTAKKFLASAISIYPNHSQANYISASIVLALADSMKGFDPPIASHPVPLSDSLKSFSPFGGLSRPVSAVEMKAINFLKASLKGNYDPQKEGDLAKLGYNTTYSDLPPFNYPMQEDPFNLIQLIKLIPRKLQTDLNDPEPAYAGQEFINGVEEFYNELTEEDDLLEKQVQDRTIKLTGDIPYQQEFLEAHNCPAHLLAARSVLLLNLEYAQSNSPLMIQMLLPYIQMWMPYKRISGNQEIPLPPEILILQCKEFWEKEVVDPIGILAVHLDQDLLKAKGDCEAMDVAYVAYLDQRAKIYNDGVDHIQNEFIQKSKRLQAWIFLNLYAIEDVPPKKINDFTYALVNRLPELVAKEKYQNENYESMLHFMEWGKGFYDRHTSACKDTRNLDRLLGHQNIKQHKVIKLPCEYQKKIITPVNYSFELKCNTKIEETSKLKKRNPNIKKGAVELSSASNAGNGPMQARGPGIFFNPEIDRQSFAPLCLEDKTPSQCTLEYNRSGNLVGLNFQLNEDGTTLKDPDSVESGVDSRWSWNAIGSRSKSYMYSLLLK